MDPEKAAADKKYKTNYNSIIALFQDIEKVLKDKNSRKGACAKFA